MSLVLEIEYLAGVAFAAIGPDSDAPDWPPQPDRVFSALVATWGLTGEDAAGAAALEWLERQPVPVIHASGAEPRTAPISFVPPNDVRSGRSGDVRVMPSRRSRQPRRFPATRPHDPVVRLHWPQTVPPAEVLAALGRLAANTAAIGHSSSLTRCRFHGEDLAGANLPPAQTPRQRIYPGRLAELRRAYAAGRRPSPGARVAPARPVAASPQSVFAAHWMVLEALDAEDLDGASAPLVPDIRAAPVLARAIRKAIMSGYERIGHGAMIPEVVSGHMPDGAPALAPHLAIAPLAFAGFEHADGRLMGFALIPPREGPGADILGEATFKAALRALAETGRDGRRVIRVWAGRGPGGYPVEIALAPTLEPDADSLRSERYTRAARHFATMTPIVLDRHLKHDGAGREDEMRGLIVAACRNIGLPEPEMIRPTKHPMVTGAVSAWASRAMPWADWQLPDSLATRPRIHAELHFAAPVRGPVLLGAGRHAGLGLCLPLRQRGEAP